MNDRSGSIDLDSTCNCGFWTAQSAGGRQPHQDQVMSGQVMIFSAAVHDRHPLGENDESHWKYRCLIGQKCYMRLDSIHRSSDETEEEEISVRTRWHPLLNWQQYRNHTTINSTRNRPKEIGIIFTLSSSSIESRCCQLPTIYIYKRHTQSLITTASYIWLDYYISVFNYNLKALIGFDLHGVRKDSSGIL